MLSIAVKVRWIVVASATLCVAGPAHAAIQWKGFSWDVTNGGMAGVAQGNPANVTIDAAGRLHLNVKKNGDTWTAAELFTTQNLGFGTYQWQIEGPVDTFDKQIVLGLFPYGPADGIGVSGTNEIDIEWARWGYADGTNVGFTNYPASGTTKGSKSYRLSLDGSTASTARFTWTSQYIESAVLKGHQAVSSEDGLLAKWKYEPENPTVNIPQQAMPLGMNLWCFNTPPSDGKNQEIVIVDFQFIKEGDPLPGGGGAGGGGAGAGSGNGGMPSGGAGSGGAGSGGTDGERPRGGSGGGGSDGLGGVAGSGGTGGVSVPGGGSANGGVAAGGAGAPSSAGTAALGGASTLGGSTSTNEGSEDSGCSCRVPSGATPRAGLWAAAALFVALRRRGGRGAKSGGAPRANA